jgi:hypothetical protein
MVQKMLNTSSDLCNRTQNVYFKDSLNSTYTRKQDKAIDDDNQQLVKRLQGACSQYSQKLMKKSVKNYDKVKTNLAS